MLASTQVYHVWVPDLGNLAGNVRYVLCTTAVSPSQEMELKTTMGHLSYTLN